MSMACAIQENGKWKFDALIASKKISAAWPKERRVFYVNPTKGSRAVFISYSKEKLSHLVDRPSFGE